MKRPIPDKVREQLKRAGEIRAAQITREERRKFGRKGWQTRLANAMK